jgi:Zn-dependent peptidase ImmA (M78 family)
MTAGQDAANLLDSGVWPGGHGDPLLPVDPVKIAGQLEIEVQVAPMIDDASGALVKRPNEPAVIYLNIAHPETRQRFTCAHELGHYTRRINSGEDAFEYVDLRSNLAAQGTDSDEIYANQFAAELLMPRPAVLASKNVGLSLLAHRFGVSIEAMSHRLANLGLA